MRHRTATPRSPAAWIRPRNPGGSALGPHVVAGLVAARDDNDPLATLSDRERTVLDLMAQGLTNAGMAKRLVLSERTVETHVRQVLIKLDIPEGDDGHRPVLAVVANLSAPNIGGNRGP